MPEKRKRQTKNNGVAVKKSKSDYVNVLMSNSLIGKDADSSDDDSDGGTGSFPAFDLPSYGGILGDDAAETEEEPKPKDDVIVINDSTDTESTPHRANGKNDIIFLSDPSMLPKPINFSAPTIMKPIVLSKNSAPSLSGGQVVLMNQPTGKQGVKIPLVQPAVLPLNQAGKMTATPTPNKNRSASKVTQSHDSHPSTSTRKFDTHVAVPVSVVKNFGGRPRIQQVTSLAPQTVTNSSVAANQRMLASAKPFILNNQNIGASARRSGNNRGNKQHITAANNSSDPMANVLANAAASAVAAGMSASTIMAQVAQAAQIAAKSALRPVAMSTPNKQAPRAYFPGLNMKNMVSPIVNNRQAPGHINSQRPALPQNGNARGSRSRNNNGIIMSAGNVKGGRGSAQKTPGASSATASKDVPSAWKPYSSTLLRVLKNMPQSNIKKLGITPGAPLNLKQIYNMLRVKFTTKQIFDMCLWDMEHADASLMEIAILNAFSQ